MNKFKDSSEKIYDFYNVNFRMPSYAEICKICDLKSKNTAHNLIKKLHALRYINIDKTGKIIPVSVSVKRPEKTVKSQTTNRGNTLQESPLILLGLVEAGFPTPSEESLHENISLDDWVIDKKEASFMLKVKGDSMQDAGILDGDMVIVERTSSPKIGQIVVAEVDGSYTMKYLKKDSSGRLYLEPANSDFKSIYPKADLQINAVVKAVVRKYK
jgi:SOS regulatory protein LexA